MHDSVLKWFQDTITPADIYQRRVLEVGSYNVNGSVRPIVEALEPAVYLGVDQAVGPGVDREVSCYDLTLVFGPESWDVVICTEVLEHVIEWEPCIQELCEVLAEGGLLALTTRSPGFPYHPYPIDTWRYPVPVMHDILQLCKFDILACEADTDPNAPGVFALARKPYGWTPLWADIDVREVFDDCDVVAMVAP